MDESMWTRESLLSLDQDERTAASDLEPVPFKDEEEAEDEEERMSDLAAGEIWSCPTN